MAANEPKRECNKPVAKTMYTQVWQLRERKREKETDGQKQRQAGRLSFG